MNKKLIKLFCLIITAAICFSTTACFDSGSGTSSSSSGTTNNEIQTEIDGWYTLVEKTVNGKDLTDTFVTNAINISGETATVYTADFSGLTVEQASVAVGDAVIKLTIGLKTYEYKYNAEEKTLEYSGKISRQQTIMRYKYNDSFSFSQSEQGVNFTDRLFGESLDENFYNYCPTALMEDAKTMHVWYCSNEKSGNVTDYVAYRKGTLTDDGKWIFSDKQIVLRPTENTWDSRHTCDPSVVKGSFKMNNEEYSYLMAYLGCRTSNNCCNEVGLAVAKKPEGPWVKLDNVNPVANFYASSDYKADDWGYGQPSLISADLSGKVFLIYTKGIVSGTFAYLEEWDLSDLNSPKKTREIALSSKNVVNASGQVDVINNADFAYDPHLQRLYCIKEDFPYPTDGGTNWITGSNTLLYIDLGNSGLDELFNEPSWNVAGKITSTNTGFARNHNMGLLTDAYGRIMNPYKIPVLYTMSDLATDYPNWNAGGQWPALHTYRIHGCVIETK